MTGEPEAKKHSLYRETNKRARFAAAAVRIEDARAAIKAAQREMREALTDQASLGYAEKDRSDG